MYPVIHIERIVIREESVGSCDGLQGAALLVIQIDVRISVFDYFGYMRKLTLQTDLTYWIPSRAQCFCLHSYIPNMNY